MKIASITANLNYLEDRPAVSVLLKTDSTKEVRILMKKGQQMKEHKAPFPIIVELFEGLIDFGVAGEKQQLKRGDLIALEASVPHDLFCIEDAIIRLTISTADSVDRVKNVAN
ncbi:cupin domain-containing protein [Cellulophaga baltica]|uniref:cupin domain-containing protein n=1 Tax=Cellulophaga baltica TaxID=76594 RepID=UPI0015F69278|nr:cupin domain-containing protein [Cellulophaga baltica]MBA6315779.1 cupin [Cellulophaga baltica]